MLTEKALSMYFVQAFKSLWLLINQLLEAKWFMQNVLNYNNADLGNPDNDMSPNDNTTSTTQGNVFPLQLQVGLHS